MKNIIFTFLLLVSYMFQVSGQANFEAKVRERMLKNKVRMQKQVSYEYNKDGKLEDLGYTSEIVSFDKNGNITQIISMEKGGKVTSVRDYAFDHNSNQTEFSLYKGNKERLTYSVKTEYDAGGNKKAETGYDGKSYFRNVFSYDASAKLSEIKYTLDNAMTERRVFKSVNGITEMNVVNLVNVVTSKETTIFDGKNNVLEESKYVQDNVAQKSNYQYDANGKKIEESQEKLGNLVYKRKYTYEGANIVQITEEKANIKPYIANVYKYDAKGNVIEEKWTKSNGGEYSKRTHKYNDNDLLLETNYYNATYEYSVVYKYNYDFY